MSDSSLVRKLVHRCRPSSISARWKVSGGRTARKQPILPLFLKRSTMSRQGDVGQAVAVVGEEHLLVLDVVACTAMSRSPMLRHMPVSTSVTRQSGGGSPSISTFRPNSETTQSAVESAACN